MRAGLKWQERERERGRSRMEWSGGGSGVALVGLEGLGDVEGVLCGVIERSHDDNKQATSVFHLNMS